MRVIKFRVWQTDVLENGPYIVYAHNVADWYVKELNNGGAIAVMQYTGLKDKNGVEIYEGDVITNYGRTNDMKLRAYQIYWNTGQARFSAKDHRAKSSTAIDDFSMEQCEVIGNIYENPELVEVVS